MNVSQLGQPHSSARTRSAAARKPLALRVSYTLNVTDGFQPGYRITPRPILGRDMVSGGAAEVIATVGRQLGRGIEQNLYIKMGEDIFGGRGIREAPSTSNTTPDIVTELTRTPRRERLFCCSRRSWPRSVPHPRSPTPSPTGKPALPCNNHPLLQKGVLCPMFYPGLFKLDLSLDIAH